MFHAREKEEGKWNRLCTHAEMYAPNVSCSRFQKPAGRRNDAFPAMKAESLYRTAGLREYHAAVFVRTDIDILQQLSVFIYENAASVRIRPFCSFALFVASFFPVEFRGEDVETSRTFSAEALCRPASFFSKTIREISVVRKFVTPSWTKIMRLFWSVNRSH